MKIIDLKNKIEAEAVVLCDENREVECGYCGDFLSFVMGKAPTNSAWFTIMTNINVAAVATLADVSVVVICENCVPDAALIERARANEINILRCKLDVFNAVLRGFDASTL